MWVWALPLSLLAAMAAGIAPAHAARESKVERVLVADPYIEFHSGPGRGFPIFYVVERNHWIEIELRHTDWFKVRAENGKQGWVERAQIERTLTEAGSTKTFRDVLLDDYLHRKLEFGAAWGHFESDPMLKLWSAYRVADTLAVEATVGQVQGTFSGTDFWHLNLVSEPWSDQRLSPFFAIGVGKFRNVPNASLVSAIDTDAKLANAMIGVRYHLTDRLIARLDYTLYTAFVADTHSAEYHAVTLGLGFFF
jgi:hypothetical protein